MSEKITKKEERVADIIIATVIVVVIISVAISVISVIKLNKINKILNGEDVTMFKETRNIDGLVDKVESLRDEVNMLKSEIGVGNKWCEYRGGCSAGIKGKTYKNTEKIDLLEEYLNIERIQETETTNIDEYKKIK